MCTGWLHGANSVHGACAVLKETSANAIVGTPYYLSPELCNGKAYDHHADVWAAGIVLFEVCTLQRPFVGESVPQLLLAIMGNRVSLPLLTVVPRCHCSHACYSHPRNACAVDASAPRCPRQSAPRSGSSLTRCLSPTPPTDPPPTTCTTALWCR